MGQFHFGRSTVAECPLNLGLMPEPTDGCDGLEDVFHAHIYKDSNDPWRMVTAISGVHTLGSAKATASGFDGFWSDSENQGKFNNNYYRSIVAKGWGPELNVGGVEGINQWARMDDGRSDSHKEMMLDTDLCLLYVNNADLAQCRADLPPDIGFWKGCKDFRGPNMGVPLLATNMECCAWNEERIR